MKPVLVFLHGWGQSGRVWQAQERCFGCDRDVRILDLPGHGGARELPAQEWEAALRMQLPAAPFILVGWSLGGMLALQSALSRPRDLRALVLVATTPRFRATPDWPCGCSDAVFGAFRRALDTEAGELRARFFRLMLRGEALTAKRRSALEKMLATPEPSPAALRTGLKLLEELDLRPHLSAVGIPVLLIHGRRDAVVPLQAGRYLATRLPRAQLHMLPGGHAPQLVRPQAFNRILEAWCRNI